MAKFNPFRPNSIINPGMFCGRWEETKSIEQSLFQTKHKNPKHFLVQGERGIGKSSLFLSVYLVATGQAETLDDKHMNFIVLSVDLIGATSCEEIVERIATAFKSEVATRQPIKAWTTKAWEFIKGWEVCGVKYSGEGQNHNARFLVDSLCDGMATFLEYVAEDVDGVLVLIDEADRPPEEARLGEFCKLFTERMTRLRCDRICLGLAGLPSLVSKLRVSHESAPRIFETFVLDPLTPNECEEVIKRGLEEAKETNGFETIIDDKALKAIVKLSEGYPHFIQQFAYSAFEADEDDHITFEDVNNGVFKENGALDQLGQRYFSELYFDKISSDDYRKVLNAVAPHLDKWVTRNQIIKSSGVKDTQVSNALRALRERGVILSNDEKQGEYKLPTKSFAVWIRALNSKKQRKEAA